MSAPSRLLHAGQRALRDTAWPFDLGADVYGWFTNQPVWRSSCARMAALLPIGESPLVADLGCGPGGSTIELARRRPDARVVGLDVAARMVRLARRRARAADVPPDRLARRGHRS